MAEPGESVKTDSILSDFRYSPEADVRSLGNIRSALFSVAKETQTNTAGTR
jgi:hypothetical protein